MPHVESLHEAREVVVALHCSGGGAGQWRELGVALGPRYVVIAPEHFGCDAAGPWTGEHPFTLADEAAATLEIVDRMDRAVHLVGHSYGGAVALRVAIERPHGVASLALYEPSAFHLLKEPGFDGEAAFAEIRDVGQNTVEGVITGDYRGAAERFVDYWSGAGAWRTLRPAVQAGMTRWLPKAPLDFRATIDEPTAADAYAQLRMPTLILRGEHAPAPTRVLADALAKLIPAARARVIDGAGHMGPVTHSGVVNSAIVRHISACRTRPAGTTHASRASADRGPVRGNLPAGRSLLDADCAQEQRR